MVQLSHSWVYTQRKHKKSQSAYGEDSGIAMFTAVYLQQLRTGTCLDV